MAKRKRNRISAIQKANGNWCTSEEEIEKELCDHYTELFKSSQPEGLQEILHEVPRTITRQMNEQLIKPVEESEIKLALFSMHPNKATDIDGMSPLFFQQYCQIISVVILNAVNSFFHSSKLLRSVMETIISLIPKVEAPVNLANYRPISLCTVLYKIISKILTNRLKKVLNHCISCSQSAFIPGRQILDNVLIAQEILHFLKNKRKGKTGFMSMKLDMSKAYDRIEWTFLGRMMLKMGFCPIFIRWIMVCISSVSYSFNLNGGKVGHVLPSRGLRQEYPLSPYLFIICAEGLSRLLKKAVDDKSLTGLKICKDSPVISHLFFADDSLLCCKATKQEAGIVKEILKKYEKALGQMVNYEQLAMIFSRNTLNQDRKEIGEELGNMTEAISGKYLGLPMAIGKSKRQVFEYVKRKISDKMQGWKQKLLSPGGKEVLIKAVVMAIPNYTMSCFKLPRSLCKDIGSRIAKFWWENGEGENRMHWASWKKLTEVKGKGGIGFRDLEAFNTALLAKQIWRFITAPNLLVSRVMKAKYMKDQWQEKKPPSSSSWAWKSIHSARHLLLNGLWKRIGDGSTVEIWKDKWITGSSNGKPASAKPANCKMQKVSDLIMEGKWDKLKLQRVFNQEEAKLIANIPLSIFRRKDRMFWKDSKSGSYTVKSGYARAKQERQSEGRREEAGEETSWEIRKHTIWKNLWKLNVKAKLKHFMWKVLQNCLPVKEVIHKRTGKGDPICEGCGEATETVEHLFFHCPIAETTWKMAPVKWEGAMLLRDNIWRWWETVIQAKEENQGRDRVNITINLLWQLWKARNKRIFEHRVIEERDVVQVAQQEWLEFEMANEAGERMAKISI